jgi:undecaprenyl-diphosphatase
VIIEPGMINHLVTNSGANLSFPSNHAANNAALATVFSAVYQHQRFIFWGWAITVMFSRVYIGVHYPFDVVSGCILGVFYGLLLVKGWDYVINKSKIDEPI